MSPFQTKLKLGLQTGAIKGRASFVWICKILIPTSFLVTLLQWGGLLHQAGYLLNPLMGLLNLPGEAALPIISGMLINIYAAIAIMTVLPFNLAQMTLIAPFDDLDQAIRVVPALSKAGIVPMAVEFIEIEAINKAG